ncbi:MAG TPA: dienelactone hydrolase family protein [Arenimonas sp.]|uniref:dienelactone hydrolase family protein n=1 Tax=Arenimonas sp. TaxID=1872635 RepID=UPI002D7E3708|nr:dienelactone hydrolase family protein [Arenimonas sp.]HEU0152394.1 dienelactone hydrolase family protein [Arenimonas sp.]
MPRPPRQTARDYDPRVMQLFDQYVHGLIDRRGFLQGASALAFSASAAVGLLASLSPRFAEARQVATDDPRIDARYVTFESAKGYGQGRGYLVRPAKADGPLPTVVVIHENRGLNPHIEDVTRRLALEGYLAFAPDALFPLGGYPGDEDAARALFQQLDQAKTREDMLAAAAFLASVEGGNGRMGAIGFCYGGAIANFLATRLPDLRAAVPFYGSAAPLADVPAIRAELLVVLASDDERVNAGWPAYEAALKAAGKPYALLQPADTLHGFHNDTTPRYAPEAAKQAWEASLALFGRTLKD